MAGRDIEELSGTLLDERTVFTLRELCVACGVHAEIVIEMVEEGVLDPRGADQADWRFSGSAVTRAQKALKLARDLRVNWPGAALALDLLEEIERLRSHRHAAWRSERLRDSDD
ncbi:MAG: chaperone modulator CbpM [Alphaproteobacteria bacterium]|nr:chaperone modulator CbpM [Alphaproteobacteria bacterium]